MFYSELTKSYKEPFVFSVSVLCFQIFTVKYILRLMAYAISIVYWLFGKQIIRNFVLLFFTDFFSDF